jgi:hypothetical protein
MWRCRTRATSDPYPHKHRRVKPHLLPRPAGAAVRLADARAAVARVRDCVRRPCRRGPGRRALPGHRGALPKLADWAEDAAVGQAMGPGWSWPQAAEALGVTLRAVRKNHAKCRGRCPLRGRQWPVPNAELLYYLGKRRADHARRGRQPR